jgi:hypothetical protein
MSRAHWRSSAAIVAFVDEYGEVYEARWRVENPRDDLAPRLQELEDQVRRQVRMAHDIAAAMGERQLASLVAEHGEGLYGGHPWQQARKAILELEAVLDQRAELAEIIGVVRPQLSAQALHAAIWGAAAALWDDGYPGSRSRQPDKLWKACYKVMPALE